MSDKFRRFLSFFDTDSGSFNTMSTKRTSHQMAIDELNEETKRGELQYFHGVLPRYEVDHFLKKDGDFMVRVSRQDGDVEYVVLSVYWDGEYRHFPLFFTKKGKVKLEGPDFYGVSELVDYYVRTGKPLTAAVPAKLITPIGRELWELDNKDIEFGQQLGGGQFGYVYQGKYRNPITRKTEDVALKVCKEYLPLEEQKKICEEAKRMRRFDHPNIIRFIGIAVHKQPMVLVLELLLTGALDLYLRKHNVSLSMKYNWCIDAAAGMAYLESQKCIHRDLAARNCLLTDDLLLKISDFGMSSESEKFTLEEEEPSIPLKWTAIESLFFRVYLPKSDVWSYGILIWEIYYDGHIPYPNRSNMEAAMFVRAGYRLAPHPEMLPQLGDLMISCWMIDPEKRPSFSSILAQLRDLQSTARKHWENIEKQSTETRQNRVKEPLKVVRIDPLDVKNPPTSVLKALPQLPNLPDLSTSKYQLRTTKSGGAKSLVSRSANALLRSSVSRSVLSKRRKS